MLIVPHQIEMQLASGQYVVKEQVLNWLGSIPTSDKNALKPSEFCLASCLRIGQPLSYSKWITECHCGTEIDEYGYHLLTCKYGGGLVREHNSILSTRSDCLSELQIGHQTEPRNRYTDTEDRPDIVMFDLETGRNEELDISLAHPWSKDAVKKAAKENGCAATTREKRKRVKYNQERLPGESCPYFTPVVFEHFGLWGVEAEKLLNNLC